MNLVFNRKKKLYDIPLKEKNYFSDGHDFKLRF